MWREALKEVADLAGWVYPSNQYRFESKFIKKLVGKICSEGERIYANVTKDLVGIHARVEKVIQLLGLGLDDHIRAVGIWGMGGLGKTTIAREVYCRIRHQFKAFSYLENVREVSTRSGLATLQQQLISDTLGIKDLDIRNTFTGDEMIWNRVRNKKVLIVLDDVDQLEQLEKLVQKLDGSNVGSRIIITTRDKQLLAAYDVRDIYEVKMLDKEESIKLFISKAFGKQQQIRPFKDLVKHAVEYAGGVPLTLKVLGSSLKGKKESEWKSALNKLKEWPDQKVLQILKISYDALNWPQKQIFLDIACFLKGVYITRVIQILDSLGFHAEIGISNLVDKSLISVEKNSVWMHDLIQELGWDIVRQESSDPGERSRLWRYDDIYHALMNNTGTKAIEGIILQPSEKKELLNIGAKAFAKMTRLRLLKICNVQLPNGLKYLSNELRYLEWDGYPLKCFPSTFRPEHLVELYLSNSCLEQLWDGKPLLPKLRIVEFRNLTNLTKCPDFTKAPELEKLAIVMCESLIDIHQSVGVLTKLNRLYLVECKNLKSFPTSMDCKSLQYLVLGIRINNLADRPSIRIDDGEVWRHDFIQELEQIPARRNMRPFRKLYDILTKKPGIKAVQCIVPPPYEKKELLNLEAKVFAKMTRLRLLKIGNVQLPNGLNNLSNELRYLNLNGCRLKCFPQTCRLEHLVKLYLSNSCLEQLWDGKLLLPKLRIVEFRNLTNLTKCPDFTEASELEELDIVNCKSLVDIHQSIGVLTKLDKLKVVGCRNLRSVPTSMDCKSLRFLTLGEDQFATCFVGREDIESPSNLDRFGCPKLMNIPEFSENMKRLSSLKWERTGIAELPLSVGHLEYLGILDLSHCQNLRSLPDSICQLKFLHELLLKGCSKLEKLPSSSGANPMELEHLCIEGCKKITSDSLNSFLSFSISRTSLYRLEMGECNLKSVPAALCSFCSLEFLKIDGNDFERLPAGMNQLSRLEELNLEGCKRLEELPEFSTTIHNIYASDCQSLRTMGRPTYNSFSHCDFSNCIRLLGNEQILEVLLSSATQAYENCNYIWQREIRFPGSEIPKWFSRDEVELHSTNRMGYATCAVVEIEKTHKHPDDDYCLMRPTAQLNVGGRLFRDLGSAKQWRPTDTKTLWITLGERYLSEDEIDRLTRLGGSDLATFTITPTRPGFKIKSCGLRVWSLEDLPPYRYIHETQAAEEEEEEDNDDVVATSMPKRRRLGCSETGNLNYNVDDVDDDEEEEEKDFF